jgi:hypothetical protein
MEITMEVPKETKNSRAPVAHAGNPSYSGERDQEDRGSKSAGENSLWDPIFKKDHHKFCVQIPIH